jgi:hypothetical protein
MCYAAEQQASKMAVFDIAEDNKVSVDRTGCLCNR